MCIRDSLYAALHVVLAEEAVPEKIRVDFMVQGCGCYSVFSPSVRDFRGPGVNWRRQETHSRLAEWMPLHCLLSRDGRNRLNVTLSEVRLPVGIYTGIREETGELECTCLLYTSCVIVLALSMIYMFWDQLTDFVLSIIKEVGYHGKGA